MIGRRETGGIRGIVLDAVGTLIEPDPPVAIAYAAAAGRQAVVLAPELVRERFRRQFLADEASEARASLATDEPTEARRWRRIVAGVLPEVLDPERAFAELWEHFGGAAAWRIFPDVEPALEMLDDAGIGRVIASNFDARLRNVLLGLGPLSRLAGSVVVSSEVGWRKPHPAFFRAACEALGLPPAAVLALGDDPENDLRGAERAGLRAGLVDRDGGHGQHPGPIVPDLVAAVRPLCGPEVGKGADPGR